ncbi:Bardet-Biedl syndrome 2 protein-like [Agrilus planipennis]|uniref:Bardet-Biedl syndrome 2 protein-like n=1 Tax=Agrilus planipennis TaxID=224129 RepID=A0A7F5R849_AGRPL|nr:Bardet-Biedl syndrome 2 protein-like [Agrilus planipennis]
MGSSSTTFLYKNRSFILIKTGEILFKDVLEHGIAGIIEADYRSNGKSDLIVATINGTIKGFSTTKPAAIMYTVEQQEEAIKELLAEKQKLLDEMKTNEKLKIKNGDRVYLEDDLISSGIIPANTKLSVIISNEDPNKVLRKVLSCAKKQKRQECPEVGNILKYFFLISYKLAN